MTPAHKLVVLDGFALNPGDLDWGPLTAVGPLQVYERTPLDQIVARAADADIVLTNKTPLRGATLAQLPALRYIGVLATGYDVVDLAAARAQAIVVTNVPSYGTDSVAQFTFALLLELCQRVAMHADAVRAGEWSRAPDFCFWRTPLVELAGKTLGIVGLGRIGRRVGAIAAAFGMRVIASSGRRADPPEWPGFRWVSVDELFHESDVISLHCPLTPATRGLINAGALALMKPTAILLNVARGPLIVEQDLAAALNSGRLAGAAVDVLSAEPPPADNPLLSARNCLVTPHMAWATREARARLLATAIANVRAFVSGHPINVIG
ncbi:MAG TPA: D-2-hydroxyacid dehydrogenase [Candidatus Binataceae bacterium]|jgi:glycerate dehydrogenase|nr:D-2-hydroxyacid dehydrogenase [Candidatus Binataceae bacterium]